MTASAVPQVLRAARDARFSRERFAPHILFENERLRVLLGAFEDGQSLPLHAPALDVVVAILSGTGELASGEAIRQVRAGDAAVIPAGSRRGLRARGGPMVALLVVSPPPGANDHAVLRTPWPVPIEQPLAADAPEAAVARLHAGFAAELDNLRALADRAGDLPGPALRRRVGHALDFLQDTLLPYMEVEEQELHPPLEAVMRAVGGGTRTMAAEHRAIEDLVGATADLSSGTLGPEDRREITRALDGLEALLRAHLAHDAEVHVSLLAQLDSSERADVAAALAKHVDGRAQPCPTAS